MIGLYLTPPAKTLALGRDEKTRVQPPDRTKPGLPPPPKRPHPMTHDDTRHGTVMLFAALGQTIGKLIIRIEAAQTHVEWRRSLRQMDREMPRNLDPPLIADTHTTQRDPRAQARLAKLLRFSGHVTPTSSSSLVVVERFFLDLTCDVIRAGSSASVNQLVRPMNASLAIRNVTTARHRRGPARTPPTSGTSGTAL